MVSNGDRNVGAIELGRVSIGECSEGALLGRHPMRKHYLRVPPNHSLHFRRQAQDEHLPSILTRVLRWIRNL